MENPETLTTLVTQDTGRRQTKQKTQYNAENSKDEQHGPHQKPGVNPGALKGNQFSRVTDIYSNFR